MALAPPPDLDELAEVVVPTLRHVYDINCERHDPTEGDDTHTFAHHIWRNSWFQLEQALALAGGWETARPDKSLTITRGRHRFHVYRCGPNENSDVTYRLEEGGSYTKLGIGRTNADQLRFDLGGATPEPLDEDGAEAYEECVIIHAGNPDDGCCGVWAGAPILTDGPGPSRWAWFEPLWLIARANDAAIEDGNTRPTRHGETVVPDLDVEWKGDTDDEPEIEIGWKGDTDHEPDIEVGWKGDTDDDGTSEKDIELEWKGETDDDGDTGAVDL